MRLTRRVANQLGQMAGSVLDRFTQRAALKRTLEEQARLKAALASNEGAVRRLLDDRARLGRDLHDGIAQSLYAAGMGLAGVKALLHPDQREALVRLEETRAVLNETMQDVRNFSAGLEAESWQAPTFREAIVALMNTMQLIRPYRATIEIDDALVARLSLAQRVNALQIAREAVSNALRHGEAAHVQVSLRQSGAGAEFTIGDDGRGINRATQPTGGCGLNNIAERARDLAADLRVDSAPCQGTRINLVLPLHPL